MVFPVDRSHIFPPNIWAVAHKNQNNRSHEISILQNLEMFCKLFAKGICTLCVFTPIFSNIYARWAKNQYHWTNVLCHSWHRLLTFVITINQNAPLRKGTWKLAFFCIGAFTYSISTPLFTKLDCIALLNLSSVAFNVFCLVNLGIIGAIKMYRYTFHV